MNSIIEAFGTAVRFVERFLGPDDDWVEDDRRIAYEAAESLFGRWHSFTVEKTEKDLLCEAKTDSDTIEQVLSAEGFQRNLASCRAYREHHNGGKQWASGAYVLDPIHTRWQQHVTLFDTKDGYTDVYAHTETSVREGMDHLTEPNYKYEDPTNRIRDIFERNNILYTKQ